MYFKHTNRPGFLLGLIDFCTAGLFFLLYMPLGGLQDEIDYILGRRTQRYWAAYLLGVPTLFIYTLVWMARISEELKAKAIEMGIEGPHTSWWHMFGWSVCYNGRWYHTFTDALMKTKIDGHAVTLDAWKMKNFEVKR